MTATAPTVAEIESYARKVQAEDYAKDYRVSPNGYGIHARCTICGNSKATVNVEQWMRSHRNGCAAPATPAPTSVTLDVEHIVAMPCNIPGVSLTLHLPLSAPAVEYAHEVSGTVYTTRFLEVWLVDTTAPDTEGFHSITLFGHFADLGALVELESWDGQMTLGDALGSSEYLAAQGILASVGEGHQNLLPY